MKYLFIDFDGTLADSSEGIFKSFRKACEACKKDCPKLREFKNEIGPPIQKIALKFFPNLKELELNKFTKIFRNDYDAESYKILKWYPNVDKTLDRLKRYHKLRFIIVSNKPTILCQTLIKGKKLDNYFDLIIGIDFKIKFGGNVFTSKAQALNYSLQKLKLESNEAIYLGDTLSDKENCLSIGMKFIAATYGFYKWEKDNLPTNYITEFSELVDVIKSLSD